jgi:Domain of unknown function (DUF6983)
MAMTIYEIPLSGDNQTFKISLGGVLYRLTLVYRGPGGWVLDIADVNGGPLVAGIPLVTGIDLLAQYAHLGFAGALRVQGAAHPDDVPDFDNLGAGARLYWVTDQ